MPALRMGILLKLNAARYVRRPGLRQLFKRQPSDATWEPRTGRVPPTHALEVVGAYSAGPRAPGGSSLGRYAVGVRYALFQLPYVNELDLASHPQSQRYFDYHPSDRNLSRSRITVHTTFESVIGLALVPRHFVLRCLHYICGFAR
jgi:hypothetical protein